MASVRKREGKRGVSRICDYVTPDGKRKRKSFKMKKYAEAYKAKVQVDMNEGICIDRKDTVKSRWITQVEWFLNVS